MGIIINSHCKVLEHVEFELRQELCILMNMSTSLFEIRFDANSYGKNSMYTVLKLIGLISQKRSY